MEEQQNKKIFSTILMMVGALFIVISGGIFVSRTWQYLPEAVKKLCLAVVAGGFFAGSNYLEKNTDLRKAPGALYYLGVCFTGFATAALLGFEGMQTEVILAFSMLVMSVPVMMRFVNKQSTADFVFQLLLADGMILCTTQFDFWDGAASLLFSVSALVMLLAGFIYYGQKNFPEEKVMMMTAGVAYGIHSFLAVICLLVNLIDGSSFFLTVIPAAMLAAAMTLLYKAYDRKALRVLQSLSFFLCSLAFATFVTENFFFNQIYDDFGIIMFVSFVLNLGIAFAMNRTEMKLVCEGWAVLFTFAQITDFVSQANRMYAHNVYYPYALCMAAAMIVFKYFEKDEADWKETAVKALVWALMGIHLLICMLNDTYCENYGMAFWFSAAALQISLRLKGEAIIKAFFRSVSLFIFLIALCVEPIIPTVFYGADKVSVLADFSVEYSCILLGIGIVLLKKICYDVLRGVSLVQFVGTCILLGVLICSNLATPALPNVMFLGIGTLIMLVAACAFHKKNYAIASAITLVLVVLYLTKEVWMSIAWWVYLFAAGVGLVIYAIKREKAE